MDVHEELPLNVPKVTVDVPLLTCIYSDYTSLDKVEAGSIFTPGHKQKQTVFTKLYFYDLQ